MSGPTHQLADPHTQIYVGDCREILGKLSSSGVKADLIFADPPFGIGQNYIGYDDHKSALDNVDFTTDWILACLNILSPTGSMWVNVPDSMAVLVNNIMTDYEEGLTLVNWCIWHYRFGQCNDSRFISSHTHALYFARDIKRRTWNPDAILVPTDRASKYNDKRTQETRRPGKRVPLDVWYGRGLGRIQGNNKERRKGHPNQIPELYMRRVIAACSDEGDLVLDPFLGSGTTSVIARAMNRRSIGIEISEASAASAFERIKGGTVR
ncbi:MAG: site-specific DNA-methyltransferase [Deltaproteobacteria bacterium]|nr:site-specific DNA-methyltransferase [Deltaproteobacteria bacterium]